MFYSWKKLLLINIVFVTCIANAQQFSGNPSYIKWQQVNTPAGRIIFPSGLDSQGKRVANIISFLNDKTQQTIGSKQKKINIVLQNQTTISNAYVQLGPFRSEFYLTPLQNSFELGSLPWPDQLAIHEFRHVQQYNNFNVGLSKAFHIVFGEEGQALANGAAIPNWFFEGDAVFNETNVSKQGRGNLPFFFNPYRSLWLANKNYNWMKLRNGSYKDFVPDHYALGYLLVAYGREKYGDEFWKNVTHDAAAFKGLFYPFQQAIKKYSGKDYVTFRNEALNYFKNDFTRNLAGKISIKNNEQFKDEEYPAYADDNTIIFTKSSYSHIHSFIIKKENEETKIRVKDVSIGNHFSYRNGKIVYAAFHPDARWGYRDYSDIRLLDVNTGKQQTITNHTKYFAPDINEDGSKIIAALADSKGKAALHLLSASDGKIITSIPNPENLFYTYPKFYNDKIIAAVRNTKGEMSLALIDPANGNTKYLTPFSYNVIGFPTVIHDTIIFSAAHKTEDNLYAFVISSEKLFQLKISNDNGIGYYQPAAINNKLAFTTFTANGFRIKQKSINLVDWQPVTGNEFSTAPSDFEVTATRKTNANLLAGVPDAPLEVTKYHKSTGLINFHSIEPTVDDPNYTLTLIGENILNTFQSQLSFTYNRTEQYKKIGYTAIYGGWFPYLSAGIDYTIDRRGLYHNKIVYWNELEPRAGFNIPLNLSNGRSITNLNFGTNYVFNYTNFKGPYKDTLGTISYSYLSNFFSITNQIQRAKRNIFPRLAQTLSLGYKRAITHYEGSQFVANANLYLPGFLVNHNIIFNAAYLKKDTIGQLNFSSGFPFSRGYVARNLYEMYKWGANYHLPLLYPDAGLANILYVSRVRTNLFYDDTHVRDFFTNGNTFKANFRSTGAELYFDTKWWNQVDVTFGIRYSRLLNNDLFGGTGRNRWELILPVNLLKN